MAQAPTILVAHLDDKEFRKSIDSLVAHVQEATGHIATNFDDAIGKINKKLKEVDTSSVSRSNDGAQARAKSQKEETAAVNSTIESYDKLVAALRLAKRELSGINPNPHYYDATEINKYFSVLEKVARLEKEINAARGANALAMVEGRQFTPNISDTVKSLTSPSDELIKLNRKLALEEKQSIRELREAYQNALKMPQKGLEDMIAKVTTLRTLLQETKGTTILTPSQFSKANEEIRKLEESITRLKQSTASHKPFNEEEYLQSLANSQKLEKIFAADEAAIKKYGEEIARTASKIKIKMEELGAFSVNFGGFSIHRTDRHGNIEEQLAAIKQMKPELDLLKVAEEGITRDISNTNQQRTAGVAITREQISALQAEKKEIDSIEALTAKILGISEKQVRVHFSHADSFEKISSSLSQMKEAYNKLNSSERASDLGKELRQNIQSAEIELKRIQAEMSRPVSFADANDSARLGLEGISERLHSLRSYAQGINTDTEEGRNELRKVNDEVEKLSEKAKELQKTTKQIKVEANSVKLGNISAMKDGDVDSIRVKIRELGNMLRDMRKEPVLDTKNIKNAEELLKRLTKQYANLYKTGTSEKNIEDALKVRPKTLAEISSTMQRLNAIRSQLNLTTQQNDIEKITKQLDKLKQKQNEVIQSSGKQAEMNNALARSWNYMKNRLAFYITVGASTQFVKSLIEIRGQYELLERSIGILIDSAQNGSKIFAELNSMAIKSPFTTMELGAAAKQLVAYDVAAKDVVDTTRRLADMAAAVGVPIERLTYALGQIKSYNYLNARDARMFANTGIPLVRELADMYTQLEGRLVSTADVYDRIKHKSVAYEDVIKVINKMTDEGGKFFNFQEKAADTLVVKLANLKLAYNNMMNEMGKSSQGGLSFYLSGTKKIFENWRSIYNTLLSIVTVVGVYKAIQLSILLTQKEITKYEAVQQVLGTRIANMAKNLKASVLALLTPVGALTAAIAVASGLLVKWIYDYYDLKKANEEFNNSVLRGTEENIASIDKFFKEYKEKLASISGSNKAEQQKMWERVREEIEKTIKNADDYIARLNKIDSVSERIKAGTNILEHQKDIQLAVNDLAREGLFDLGGDALEDRLGKDLNDYAESLVEQGSFVLSKLAEAGKGDLAEVNKELDKFISRLNKVNLNRVIGVGDREEQLNNVRSFVAIVRDMYLATEDGSKVTYDGQVKLNDALDKWVDKVADAKGLYDEMSYNGRRYSVDWVRRIEKNRSAWQRLFSRLSAEQRQLLDYAVETNQVNSKEIKKMWTDVVEDFSKREKVAYDIISNDILELRNKPAIVFDIIYRTTEDTEIDKQRKWFTERFINPDGEYVLTPKAYKQAKDENIKRYGTYIKGTDEDNVEWEARLGKEYRDNADHIKRLNGQLKNREELNEIDREAKQEELETLKAKQKVLEEIAKVEHFNYEKDKKGAQKDVLGEALSKEVSIISEIQKKYKEYRDLGVSGQEAVNKVSEEYDSTLKAINKTLTAYGFKTLNNKEIATSSMRDIISFYKEQSKWLDTLSSKTEKSAEALDKGIANLNFDVTKFDYSELIKGLSDGLNKLKEEYQLSVSLDAQPELGKMFSELYGIDTSELPHTFSDLVSKAQQAIEEEFAKTEVGMEGFGVMSIDMSELLDKDKFDTWVESMSKKLDSDFIKAISNVRNYLISMRVKESEDAIKNWDKLLEKYSEYEYKQRKISVDSANERLSFINKFGTDEQKAQGKDLMSQLLTADTPEAREKIRQELIKLVKEIAENDNVKLQIAVGINTSEAEQQAALAFEEFKKSPFWTTAIGDLNGMTVKAMRSMVKSLEDFKKANDALSPQKLKQINSTIKKLNKEIRKNNPFSALVNSVEIAKDRQTAFQTEITKTKKELKELEESTEDDGNKQTKIDTLKKKLKDLLKAKKEVGKVDAQEIVSGINEAIGIAKQATEVVTDMMDALGGKGATKASEKMKEVMGILEEGAKGAQIGSIGGGWGALIGGIAGVVTGIAKARMDVWTGNKGISDSIEASVKRVKTLELAYKELDDAINRAYGTASVAANKLAIANKELQLTELRRQLSLEQSRKAKNRDEDAILDLKGQIKDLELEIKNATSDIVNDLLGVSSVGDAMENLMGSFVEALRSGEDAMESFDESIDDMIANMIKKMLVTKILQPWADNIWKGIEDDIAKRGEEYEDSYAWASAKLGDLKGRSGWYEISEENLERIKPYISKDEYIDAMARFGMIPVDRYRAAVEKIFAESESGLNKASQVTIDDIREYAKRLRDGGDVLESLPEEAKALIDEFDLWKKNAKELSGLQQGIQSITEDTAGAIEAYMNGVSQQVYHHSELLQQIRDAVMGIDHTESLGTMAQMLLTLQSSYQTQNAIRSIMEGWSSDNGRSVRIEMVS